MQNRKCPICGSDTTPDTPCACGAQAGANGVAQPSRTKPTPPAEVARWVIEPVPPQMREEFLRTFNEAEFLAALREVESGGGHQFEDFIDEIERITNGGK